MRKREDRSETRSRPEQVVEEDHVGVDEAASGCRATRPTCCEGRVEARGSVLGAREVGNVDGADRTRSSATPLSSPRENDLDIAAQATQLSSARRWISPIRPAKGLGTEKTVSTSEERRRSPADRHSIGAVRSHRSGYPPSQAPTHPRGLYLFGEASSAYSPMYASTCSSSEKRSRASAAAAAPIATRRSGSARSASTATTSCVGIARAGRARRSRRSAAPGCRRHALATTGTPQASASSTVERMVVGFRREHVEVGGAEMLGDFGRVRNATERRSTRPTPLVLRCFAQCERDDLRRGRSPEPGRAQREASRSPCTDSTARPARRRRGRARRAAARATSGPPPSIRDGRPGGRRRSGSRRSRPAAAASIERSARSISQRDGATRCRRDRP